MKKRILALALATLVVITITACSRPSNTEQSEAASASTVAPDSTGSSAEEPAKQDVTISFFTNGEWIKPFHQKMFDDFTAETGIKFDIITTSSDTNRQVLGAKIATGEISDIVEYYNGNTGRSALLADKNFEDLSDEPWISRVSPTMLDAFSRWEGKVYGFPYQGAGYWGVLYNKQVFADNGITEVPITFEELTAVCETLKNAGITPMYVGAADIWPNEIWWDVYWGAAISKKYPDFMEKYGRNEVKFADNPDVVLAFQRQLDFYNAGYFGATTLSDTYDGGHAALYEGNAAMIAFFDLVYGEGIAKYPDFADKIGFMPFPVDGSGTYGVSCSNSLYIYNKSPHIAEAKQFLDFLARKENLEYFYNEQKLAPWWTDITVELLPQTLEAKAQVDAGNGATMWFDFIPASYGEAYAQVGEMLLGNITPKQVAEAFDSEIARDAQAQGLAGW